MLFRSTIFTRDEHDSGKFVAPSSFSLSLQLDPSTPKSPHLRPPDIHLQLDLTVAREPILSCAMTVASEGSFIDERKLHYEWSDEFVDCALEIWSKEASKSAASAELERLLKVEQWREQLSVSFDLLVRIY